MKKEMTSRQRMLAALNHEEVDYVPCSFMMYKGLFSKCKSYLDFIRQELALGLDTYVQIPPRPPNLISDSYNLHGLPVNYHPTVEIKEWKEEVKGERWPILIKEYSTPAGILRAEVYQDDDWPFGDHVPFLNDFVDTRSRKFIVENENDLKALKYLLVPSTEEEIQTFRDESNPVLDFAHEHDLLVAGGWGVGADLISWVFGLENMIYASYDQPDLLLRMLGIIEEWNRHRMKVVIDAGIDLYIKRAWYENCDFWSPSSWKKYIYPILKEDIKYAHSRGIKFGYLITANTMPLLDMVLDIGVDVLIGVDPMKWDLEATKQKLKGKICLWGGINGHLTIEQGSSEQIKHEFKNSMDILAPGGGFILSPVDNVREDTALSQENVQSLIDMWKLKIKN